MSKILSDISSKAPITNKDRAVESSSSDKEDFGEILNEVEQLVPSKEKKEEIQPNFLEFNNPNLLINADLPLVNNSLNKFTLENNALKTDIDESKFVSSKLEKEFEFDVVDEKKDPEELTNIILNDKTILDSHHLQHLNLNEKTQDLPEIKSNEKIALLSSQQIDIATHNDIQEKLPAINKQLSIEKDKLQIVTHNIDDKDVKEILDKPQLEASNVNDVAWFQEVPTSKEPVEKIDIYTQENKIETIENSSANNKDSNEFLHQNPSNNISNIKNSEAVSKPISENFTSHLSPQIPDQIKLRIEQSSHELKSGTGSINVQLEPKNLGQVDITIQMMESSGDAKLIISADNKDTLVLLKEQVEKLQESLEKIGINTSSENTEFNLKDGNKGQNQPNPNFYKVKNNYLETEKIIEDPSVYNYVGSIEEFNKNNSRCDIRA